MTKRDTYVCDGCGAWCKLPNGDWLRSIAYVDIREYDRTAGGKKQKKHICTDVKEADDELACVDFPLDEDPEGRHLEITWAYNTEEERITGAKWTITWGYHGENHERHNKAREEFPEWIEERAELIEELVYA